MDVSRPGASPPLDTTPTAGARAGAFAPWPPTLTSPGQTPGVVHGSGSTPMAGPQVAQAMPLQANPHERNEQSADRASNEPGDSVSAPQGVVRSQPTPDLFRDMDSSSLTGRIPDMFQAGLTPGQPSDHHGSPPYREYAPDSSCQPGGATSPGQPSQDQLNPMALLLNLQSQLNMMQQRLAESERERDNVAEALGEHGGLRRPAHLVVGARELAGAVAHAVVGRVALGPAPEEAEPREELVPHARGLVPMRRGRRSSRVSRREKPTPVPRRRDACMYSE